MKKIFSAFVIAVCCMFMAMPAQAQLLKWGVKGGVNISPFMPVIRPILVFFTKTVTPTIGVPFSSETTPETVTLFWAPA